MKPLAVVPSYARRPSDLEQLGRTVHTLVATSGADVLVVDDAGPLEGAGILARSLGQECVRLGENGGFSKAVNAGLRRAHGEGRDAVLVNSDVEFIEDGWLLALEDTGSDIVGALLLYPHKHVQHAGAGYSSFSRAWDHRFRWAPADLREVYVERVCPVTAALQLVRREVMDRIGFYDEEYGLCFEDVDYCLRAFDAGLECRYQPLAVAVHHEMLTRGDGVKQEAELASRQRLFQQHTEQSMRRFPL